MISVHISPGYDPTDWDASELMYWIGPLWVDMLGRSSVPALSVISGFLIAYNFEKQSIKTYIWRRFQSLYIPMVVWTGLLAGLLLAAALLFSVYTRNFFLFFDTSPIDTILRNILFLYREPANVPLTFLRDLFVSSVLATIILRYVGFLVVPIFVFSALIWQTIGFGEIIFRGSIPTFMLAGIILQQRIGHLSLPQYTIFVSTFAFLVILTNMWFGFLGAIEETVGATIWNAALRLVLTVWILDIAYRIAKRGIFLNVLTELSKVSYLAYLSHTVVIYSSWEILERILGSNQHPLYALFFVAMPFLVFFIAIALQKLIWNFPALIQIAVTGKSKRFG